MSEHLPIRRILVAVDASPGSLAAARAAAELAAHLEAEIEGLFVEDTQLLDLARSPLAGEADFQSQTLRELETPALEQQLRAHANRARAALEKIAGPLGVRWSFRVARGQVAREILAAAAGADLVSLGHVGWSVRRREHLGSILRALLGERRQRMLLLERPVEIRAPVVVLFDGSEGGLDALAVAVQLAALTRSQPSVLLVGDEEAALRATATEGLGDTLAQVEWIGATDGRIANAVVRRAPGVLVVPTGRAPLDAEHLRTLLVQLRCPVLAVS